MCGRFEQSGTRRYYGSALGIDTSDYREWHCGDRIPSYNIAPGLCPWLITLDKDGIQFIGLKWGYRTPQEAAEKKKPWINARVEKALTGRYFRHVFREGRLLVPAGGWFEWTVEDGKKQPWYITRRTDDPIFMAGITNWKTHQYQSVEVGFVIVTQDSIGGMVDIHDRWPVVLEPADAWRWTDPETSTEEAALIAQSKSLPVEEFMWWRIDSAMNRAHQPSDDKRLLAPVDLPYT